MKTIPFNTFFSDNAPNISKDNNNEIVKVNAIESNNRRTKWINSDSLEKKFSEVQVNFACDGTAMH